MNRALIVLLSIAAVASHLEAQTPPTPDFVGIRSNTSMSEAKRIMAARPGLTFDPKQSSKSRLVFHGGSFLERAVDDWGLDFSARGFIRGAATIRPETDRHKQFDQVRELVTKTYGPPAAQTQGKRPTASWTFRGHFADEQITVTLGMHDSPTIGAYVKFVYVVERANENKKDL